MLVDAHVHVLLICCDYDVVCGWCAISVVDIGCMCLALCSGLICTIGLLLALIVVDGCS